MKTNRLVISALAGVGLAAAPGAGVGATDWYVDQGYVHCASGTGGPVDPFCTITAALLVALHGDTIRIAPGAYQESLWIDRDVHLIGTAGAGLTRVVAPASRRAVRVVAPSQVRIEGLAIQGGLADRGAGIFMEPATMLTLTRATVRQNSVVLLQGTGGGIYAGAGSVLGLVDSVVEGNMAYTLGGGLHAIDSQVTITNSTFQGNQCYASGAGGGGIHVAGGNLSIAGSTLSCNSAQGYYYYGYVPDVVGGGVFAAGSDVDVSGTTFSANDSGRGGGMFLESGSLTVCDSDFRNNTSKREGGGIATAGTVSVLDGTTLEGNTSHGGGGASFDGPTTLTNSTVTANTCTFRPYVPLVSHRGGGILALDSFEAEDCRFRDNVVDINNFSMHVFSGRGGGLFLGGSSILRDCDISGNRVIDTSHYQSNSGGGIEAEGDLELLRCSVVDNHVDRGSGGGIAILGPGACLMTNSTVEDNSARFEGGGILNNLASATLYSCTIAGNDALVAGGGVVTARFLGSGTTTLQGSVIARNTASTSPDCKDRIDSLGHNLIGDTQGCTVVGGGGTDLLDVFPLFAAPGSGDYRLQAGSPAVDSSYPFSGGCGRHAFSPRLVDGNLDGVRTLDRGAYEFRHVDLGVSGSFQSGSPLTVTVTGTAGLSTWLIAGIGRTSLLFGSFGCLHVDLSRAFALVPLGVLPVPPLSGPLGAPAGTRFYLQALAISAPGIGNLSNELEVLVD